MVKLAAHLLAFFFAFLIGSIPINHVVVRFLYKKDLHQIGSGDVGVLNAYRASGSLPLALVLCILELVKGFAPLWLVQHFYFGSDSLTIVLVGGVLLGDVFSPWLHFHGSRGVGVAIGAMLFVDPRLVIISLVLWTIYYLLIRKHIVAILLATFGLPLIVFFTRNIYFNDNVLLLTLLVCILVFERHLCRIPDLIVRQEELKGREEGHG